jgi:hypothetical protein
VAGSRVCITPFSAMGSTPQRIAVVRANRSPNFQRPETLLTVD